MLMSSLLDVVESNGSNHGRAKSLYENGDARGWTKQRRITLSLLPM